MKRDRRQKAAVAPPMCGAQTERAAETFAAAVGEADGCRFMRGTIAGAKHPHPTVANCTFDHVTFVECDFRGIRFTDVRFDHCDLSNLRLDGAAFCRTEIAGC